MKTELILKSDVLDIIFEHRNKSYGAYNLRKFYENRLMKSVGVMLALVILLSAFTFISPKKIVLEKPEYITTTGSIPLEKKPEIKEKKPATPAKAQKPVDTRIFIKNMTITKDSVVAPLDEIKDNIAIGNVNITVPGGTGEGLLVGQVAGGGEGIEGGEGKDPDVPVVSINIPLESPEIMPAFPGGMDGLRKFLERNLTNPRDLEEGEVISVKMRFVVGYDGKLKSFETVQDGGAEFNKEVMRVLKKMPDWIPGKSRGQNVPVYYTIPVKFVSAN